MEHVKIGGRDYGMWLEGDQVCTPELVNHLVLFVQKRFGCPNQTKAETWFEQKIWIMIL